MEKYECSWCHELVNDLIEWHHDQEDMGWCSQECISNGEEYADIKLEGQQDDI